MSVRRRSAGCRWLAGGVASALVLLGCGAGELARDGAIDADGGVSLDGGGDAGGGRDAARDAPLDVDASVDEGFDGGTDVGFDGGVGTDAGGGGVDAGEACPRRYFLAPGGDDTRAGRDEASALQSIARVEALLVADPPTCDVEVWIAPGVYREQRVSWRTTDPTIRITFRASDRERRPIFDGCAASGSCTGGTFFSLRHSAGEDTNLHFWYLHVRNYQTAISLNGDRNSEAASNGGNRIFGCYFERIGNVFEPGLEPSTACVRLVNSDDNEIANNHFVDVINTRSGALIHAIYVAHMSDRNTITGNRFVRSTGDPVRVRDFSNDNVITDNRFVRVGTQAGYTDWYCDHDARSDCTKPTPECPSWGSQFRDNVLDGTWTCGPLATFHYFQDEATTGCMRPAAEARRLRTSGNTQTSAPCSME